MIPSEQPALVRDLMQPRAYPAPQPGVITLRSTHASWVFLTGDDVWKIKRPVKLGFLDFRSPEARVYVPVDTRGEPAASIASALVGLRAAGIVPARERCLS